MKNLQGTLFSLVLFPKKGEEDLDGFIERVHWAFSACQVNLFRASMIFHDMDETAEGLKKQIHVHMVINTKIKRTRFSTLLNLLGLDRFYQTEDGGKYIDIDPSISLAIGKDEIGLTRYLCHFDNPEKYCYSAFDVETTAPSFLEFAFAEGAKIEEMDMFTLIDLCQNSVSFLEFLKTLPQYYVAKNMYFVKELYRSVHEEKYLKEARK